MTASDDAPEERKQSSGHETPASHSYIVRARISPAKRSRSSSRGCGNWVTIHAGGSTREEVAEADAARRSRPQRSVTRQASSGTPRLDLPRSAYCSLRRPAHVQNLRPSPGLYEVGVTLGGVSYTTPYLEPFFPWLRATGAVRDTWRLSIGAEPRGPPFFKSVLRRKLGELDSAAARQTQPFPS
jgi:hypothetical protein